MPCTMVIAVCHLIEYMSTLCCVQLCTMQCASKFVFNESTSNRIHLNKYKKVKTVKFYCVQICCMYNKGQSAFKISEPSK